MGLKTVLILPIDDQHLLQLWQITTNLSNHQRVIEITKPVWNNEDFCLTKLKHETKFALTENRHQWIANRTNPYASQMKDAKLPAIG